MQIDVCGYGSPEERGDRWVTYVRSGERVRVRRGRDAIRGGARFKLPPLAQVGKYIRQSDPPLHAGMVN